MVHLTDRFKLFLNYFDCTLIVILFRNQLLCDPVPRICLNALSNITLQQAFEIPEHRIIQIYLCFAISVNKPLHIKFITITDLAYTKDEKNMINLPAMASLLRISTTMFLAQNLSLDLS